jgi:hypothetical protein
MKKMRPGRKLEAYTRTTELTFFPSSLLHPDRTHGEEKPSQPFAAGNPGLEPLDLAL